DPQLQHLLPGRLRVPGHRRAPRPRARVVPAHRRPRRALAGGAGGPAARDHRAAGRLMGRLFAGLAALAAFSAGALGAFAGPAPRGRLGAAALATFEIGARYQMYHALALIAVAVAQARWPGVGPAGWLFVLGIVLFSGSLYGLALGGPRWLGAVTPLGGVAFLAGWAWLAWLAWAAP